MSMEDGLFCLNEKESTIKTEKLSSNICTEVYKRSCGLNSKFYYNAAICTSLKKDLQNSQEIKENFIPSHHCLNSCCLNGKVSISGENVILQNSLLSLAHYNIASSKKSIKLNYVETFNFKDGRPRNFPTAELISSYDLHGNFWVCCKPVTKVIRPGFISKYSMVTYGYLDGLHSNRFRTEVKMFRNLNIVCVACSKQMAETYTVGDDIGTIRQYDIQSNSNLYTSQINGKPTVMKYFSNAHDHLLVGTSNGYIHLVDRRINISSTQFSAESALSDITELHILNDEYFYLSVTIAGHIVLHDIRQTKSVIRRFNPQKFYAGRICLNQKQNLIFAIENKWKLCTWSINTGHQISKLSLDFECDTMLYSENWASSENHSGLLLLSENSYQFLPI